MKVYNVKIKKSFNPISNPISQLITINTFLEAFL